MRIVFAFIFLLFVIASGFYFIGSIMDKSASNIIISIILLIGSIYGYLKLSNFDFTEEDAIPADYLDEEVKYPIINEVTQIESKKYNIDSKCLIFRMKISFILFVLFGSIFYLSYLFMQENKISKNNYLVKFRIEHPEFKYTSDNDLAKDIYTVFYKDIKEEDYYKRIGIDSPEKQKEQKILLYMSMVMAIFFLYITIKRISLLSEFKNSISKNIKQISIIVFSILLLTILFLLTGGIYEYKSDYRGIPMFRINKITGNLQGFKSGEWTNITREER